MILPKIILQGKLVSQWNQNLSCPSLCNLWLLLICNLIVLLKLEALSICTGFPPHTWRCCTHWVLSISQLPTSVLALWTFLNIVLYLKLLAQMAPDVLLSSFLDYTLLISLLLWLLYLGLEPFQGQGSTHFSLHVSGFGTVSGTGLAPCRPLVGCIDLFPCLLDSAVLYAVCKSLTAVVLGKGAAENSNLTCPSQSARPLGQVYLTPCIGNLLG